MSKLDDFLNLENVDEVRENIKIKINGKELELVIRPITEKEHNTFQKRCNEIKGKVMSFDSAKYNNLLIENCIVEPNFNDANFLSKVNCVSAIDFLTKKFPAGVLTDIALKIQNLSGFESYEMEIENAKN